VEIEKGTSTNPKGERAISREEYEALLAENATLKGTVSSLKSENAGLQYDLQYLRFQLDELKRALFGRKSEKSPAADPLQLELFTPAEAVPEPKAPEKELISYERAKAKQQPVRTKLPEHLRHEVEIIEPAEIPEGAVKISEVRSEQLEYKPADVYVKVTVRPKYAVPGAEGKGCVVIAPLPEVPFPKSIVGAGLAAHICVSKFVDHLPFYRQAQIFKREKIPLPESTVKGAFAATCRLMEPLYQSLCARVRTSAYLQADESPLPVLTADKPA
jgi:transposase